MKEGLAIIGAQYGDEGKGKLVDYLAQKADFIVRFNGGNNAGHTVIIGKKEFKQHLLPSGVFHKGKRNLISSGVVISPKVLLTEIETLKKNGIAINKKNLGIDYRAHIIMPWHILQEGGDNSAKIGTTQRGIGPCYEDKATRTGIRFEDLLSSAILTSKIQMQYENKVKLLGRQQIESSSQFTYASILSEYLSYGRQLKDFACDVSEELSVAHENGKSILFEGAQGVFLDNNFGTYPFVTSSNVISAAAALTCGVSPSLITKVEAVVKAYTTRVGNGPFVTEIPGELGEKIRQKGGEFGTTTGRARRVGYLDLPLLRTANRLNGFTGIHLTKLDVLECLDEIKVCTHYELNGKKLLFMPANSHDLEKCKPIYQTFNGFGKQDWLAIAKKGKTQKLKALPQNAYNYIKFIEKELSVPLASVSVGPERDEIIFLR